MGILDKIKSTIGLDGGLKEKDADSERIEPIVKGALYRGGDKRDFLGRIEPSNHGLDDYKVYTWEAERRQKEWEAYQKANGISVESGEDRASRGENVVIKLELDSHEEQKFDNALNGKTENRDWEKTASSIMDSYADLKTKYDDLKIDHENLSDAIMGVAVKAGIAREGVDLSGPTMLIVCDKLKGVVKSRTAPTANIGLEGEVEKAMKMDHTTRQSYYQVVRHERGDKEVGEIVAAVKKQRTKNNAMEMG